jgi:hypothetical protein
MGFVSQTIQIARRPGRNIIAITDIKQHFMNYYYWCNLCCTCAQRKQSSSALVYLKGGGAAAQ